MLDKINEIVKPIVEELDLSVYDIEYVKENNEYFLRIYIDKKGGVDLSAIVEATTPISEALDIHDPIENAYILEVSSPGAEKPLKNEEQLKNVIDEYVYIEFKQQVSGKDNIEGFLTSFDQGVIKIEYLEKTRKKYFEVEYENVKKARLAIKF